jgi:hypothetical protein
MGVLTVGVDLAAEPVRMALATVAWNGGTAVITQLIRGADDEVILAALADADKVPPTGSGMPRYAARAWAVSPGPSTSSSRAACQA